MSLNNLLHWLFTGGRKFATAAVFDELTLFGEPGMGLNWRWCKLWRWLCEASLEVCGSMFDEASCCGLDPAGVLGLMRVGCSALPLSDPSGFMLVKLPTLVARLPRARLARGPEALKDPSRDEAAGMVGLVPRPEAPDDPVCPSALEDEVVTASLPLEKDELMRLVVVSSLLFWRFSWLNPAGRTGTGEGDLIGAGDLD